MGCAASTTAPPTAGAAPTAAPPKKPTGDPYDEVNWPAACAALEAYEITLGFPKELPGGWHEGMRTANKGADAALDKVLDATAGTWEGLDAALGIYAPLPRPFMKLRAVYKFGDAKEAAAAVIKAIQSGSVPDAVAAGLLPVAPADPSALPEQFKGIGTVPHKGKLVADGGNLPDNNEECYAKIVELAGGADKAVIGVACLAACSTAEDMSAEWVDHQLPHNKFEKAAGSFALAGVPAERVMLIPFTLANMATARNDDAIVDMNVVPKPTSLEGETDETDETDKAAGALPYLGAGGERKRMLVAVTRCGFGKRMDVDRFKEQGRGGKGMIAMKFKRPDDELLALSQVERNG